MTRQNKFYALVRLSARLKKATKQGDGAFVSHLGAVFTRPPSELQQLWAITLRLHSDGNEKSRVSARREPLDSDANKLQNKKDERRALSHLVQLLPLHHLLPAPLIDGVVNCDDVRHVFLLGLRQRKNTCTHSQRLVGE